MTRSIHNSAGRPGQAGRSDHSADDAPAGAALLDRSCLLVLLALIPLRAVIGETHTFEVPRLFRHLDAPDAAMPATTFGMFVVICAVASIAAFSRACRGGRRLCWTGIELGAGLLLLAMVVSTLRAGQKHLAIIGSLDFLGMLLYAVTLRQLLTRPWHLRLVLCVVLAAGAVVLAKCGYQKWVETPDTIRYFEEHREELIGAAAPEQTERQAGFLHDYEQRLRSGAVSGYFAHPNVLASYLILVVMTGLGLAAERWRRVRGWSVIAPLIIAGGGVVMLVYSQSKGAGFACGVAMFIWLVAHIARGWVAGSPRTAALGVWAGLILGASLLLSVLHANPEALGRSILFRTFYWRGAWSMVQQEGVLGVGAGNFGRIFTRYKDAACPEDVEDPHSWVVKAFAEWGALGLAGLVLVLAGVTWKLASVGRVVMPGERAGGEGEGDGADDVLRPRHEFAGGDSSGGAIILWTAGLGAIVFGWWGMLISGAAGGYAALVLHLPAILWVAGFVVVSLEPRAQRRFIDEPIGPALAPLVAGMIGFVLHSGIDLAMFNGGAATSFFAILAVCVAMAEMRQADRAPSAIRSGDRHARGRGAALPAGVAFAGLCVAVLVALARPAAEVGGLLRLARTSSDAGGWDGYQTSSGFGAYRRAAEVYPLDGTALDELLEQLERRVSRIEHIEDALPLVDELRRRDPRNAAAWQHAATLNYQRFAIARDTASLERAIEAMREAVGAYPTSPTRRLTLADLYERLGEATGSGDARKAAAEELQRAMELDEARVYVSKPHRFTDETTRMIRSRIHRLQAGL